MPITEVNKEVYIRSSAYPLDNTTYNIKFIRIKDIPKEHIDLISSMDGECTMDFVNGEVVGITIFWKDENVSEE